MFCDLLKLVVDICSQMHIIEGEGGDTITKKFNQQEYINEYIKETYKEYRIRIRKDNAKLIKHLENQPNKSAYIIKLIEDDIKK